MTISCTCLNSGRWRTFLSTELRKLYDPPPGRTDEYSSASRSGLSKSPTLLTYRGVEKSGKIIGLSMSCPLIGFAGGSCGGEVDIRGLLHEPVAEPAAHPVGGRVRRIETEVRVRQPALEQLPAERGDRRGRVSPLAKIRRGVENTDRSGIARLAQHSKHRARLAVVPQVEQPQRDQPGADLSVEGRDPALARKRRPPASRERRVGERRAPQAAARRGLPRNDSAVRGEALP